MDNGPPFPFAELYGSAQAARGGPRVVPGVAISAWKTDARALRCGICLKKFTLLRWKHHCRVCGDVCCRRCLGFCLVDVPLLGVDLAFTCARCIRRVATKQPAFPDPEASGTSYMTIMSSPLSSSSLSSSSSVDQIVTPATSCPSSPSSAVLTANASALSASFNCAGGSDQLPTSFATALQLRSAAKRSMAPVDVTVSQSRNAKLQSVCALVGDYLECAGAAVVLLSPDRHVWVVAHRGLRSRLLHNDAFLALCQRARDQNASFALSEPKSRAAGASAASADAFRFAAVAPLRRRLQAEDEEDKDDGESEDDGKSDAQATEALGCLLALGTRARSDSGASRVRKTLENLARLVMDLLVEEKSILRIFESGDFKIFAANAMDLAPATASVFEQCGVANSNSNNSSNAAAAVNRRKRSTPLPLTGGYLSSMVMNHLRRSRSFNCIDCEIAAAAAAASSPSPTAAASPSPAGTTSSRRARPVLIEDDGFDIVAHPGMNHGRKHAATNLGASSSRPACTSNCRTGPHHQRRRYGGVSPAAATSTAA